MKRLLTFSLLLCLAMLLSPKHASAQFELGFQGGTTHYQGDLVAEPTQFKGTQYGVGIFGRYNFLRHYAARLGLNYGKMVGDDLFYPEYSDRIARNLDFESYIFDATFMLEVSISSFFNKDFDMVYRRKRNGSKKLDFYLFGGVGLFMFNPQTTYDGEVYDLHDYETELNKEDYALMQINVPVGVGITFPLKNGWKIGIESSYRITFTDYLDDVSTVYSADAGTETVDGYLSDPGRGQYAYSVGTGYLAGGRPAGMQRGNPDNNDGYLFTNITLIKDVSGLFSYKGYKSARHKKYKRGKKYKPGKGYRKLRR